MLFVRVEQVRVGSGSGYFPPLNFREPLDTPDLWNLKVSQPDRGRRYTVIHSDLFESDWTLGIRDGWINPMADPQTLDTIKRFLAQSPWAPRPVPEWPDNMRAIDFPRSARNPIGRLRIRYEIVEDDQEVILLSVASII